MRQGSFFNTKKEAATLLDSTLERAPLWPSSFKKNYLFLIEAYLLYNSVLVSAIHQHGPHLLTVLWANSSPAQASNYDLSMAEHQEKWKPGTRSSALMTYIEHGLRRRTSVERSPHTLSLGLFSRTRGTNFVNFKVHVKQFNRVSYHWVKRKLGTVCNGWWLKEFGGS